MGVFEQEYASGRESPSITVAGGNLVSAPRRAEHLPPGYWVRSSTSPSGRSADPQAFRGRQEWGDVQRCRGRREVDGSEGKLLSGDSVASDRIAPAGSRLPPHRTGRAPFKASGSPSDGLDQSREHQPSAIVVGCIHPFSGVVRSVPHPSDCPPSLLATSESGTL